MASYIFASRSQYWAALKNTHNKINTSRGNLPVGLRRNLGFNEKQFQKGLRQGKAISLSEVRKRFKIVKDRNTKILKKQWQDRKDKGYDVGTFKSFLKANNDKDYDLIKESFNSP